MKKEWLTPELDQLNVQETKEALECEISEESYTVSGEKCIFPHDHICKKCGYDFGHWIGSHIAWDIHRSRCDGNSQVPPQTPLS